MINANAPTLPIVSARAVSKEFANGTRALAAVDLDLVRGEFVALLGPSGCGKSTLLRMIAGLIQPTGGEIVWPGEAARSPVAAARAHGLGFVFQEPTLMPWARAVDNVAMPLVLGGAANSDARERAAEMLDRVGLGGFVDSYPRELSGGMKMRVSLARALVTEPRILLMDEPFAALDEITRHKLNDDLLALWGRQRFTVLFVTHSVFESVYLAERIVIMAARPGRVFAIERIEPGVHRDVLYRTSPEYARLTRVVSARMAEAIAA
jgi:NitT/TauT family transport system ATP-binding protein